MNVSGFRSLLLLFLLFTSFFISHSENITTHKLKDDKYKANSTSNIYDSSIVSELKEFRQINVQIQTIRLLFGLIGSTLLPPIYLLIAGIFLYPMLGVDSYEFQHGVRLPEPMNKNEMMTKMADKEEGLMKRKESTYNNYTDTKQLKNKQYVNHIPMRPNSDGPIETPSLNLQTAHYFPLHFSSPYNKLSGQVNNIVNPIRKSNLVHYLPTRLQKPLK